MEGLFIIGVIIVSMYLVSLFFGGKHHVTKDVFTQHNVTVYLKTGVIEINGKCYPVSSVRGLKARMTTAGSEAIISVDDLSNPLHEVGFFNRFTAEDFIEKLSLAIEKAGGPVLR